MMINPNTPRTAATKTEIAKNFVGVKALKNIFLGVPFFETFRPELVILLPLVFVLEHRVGLVDVLELLFSLGIVLVVVGMVLQRLFLKGFLDLVIRGSFGDTECVVVAFHSVNN